MMVDRRHQETRRPVILKNPTWMITDSVSITNSRR